MLSIYPFAAAICSADIPSALRKFICAPTQRLEQPIFTLSCPFLGCLGKRRHVEVLKFEMAVSSSYCAVLQVWVSRASAYQIVQVFEMLQYDSRKLRSEEASSLPHLVDHNPYDTLLSNTSNR